LIFSFWFLSLRDWIGKAIHGYNRGKLLATFKEFAPVFIMKAFYGIS
jgi:hypothetical protein